MAITTVDEFVEQRVAPALRPVVQRLRELMRELVPKATEVYSYGVPTYGLTRGIAVISPTKKDITFAFSQGAAFEDKYKLLVGVGKVSKNLKFKTVADLNKTQQRYYLKQAIAHDQIGQQAGKHPLAPARTEDDAGGDRPRCIDRAAATGAAEGGAPGANGDMEPLPLARIGLQRYARSGRASHQQQRAGVDAQFD